MTPSDTDRSWALFPRGLLVFERAEPGSANLLVSKIEACATPGCACREISLRAVTLDADDDFDPATLSGDALHARFATEAMEARLDIDTGCVVPDDYDGRVPLHVDWVEYLQSQIDGELLDLLHEVWLRAKGTKSAPKTDWAPRESGDLVGWYEAHPSDRSDSYLVGDDGAFIAEDLFCVKATCTCDEAVVAFVPAQVADAEDVGSIRLRISTLDILERRVEAHDAKLLDRLWNAYTARHRRLTDRLSQRSKQMVELASDRSRRRTPVLSTPRAGRNQPCPCGSGKKYKRCCG